jgi:hypothetical protein
MKNMEGLDNQKIEEKKNYLDYSSDEEVAFEEELRECNSNGKEHSKALDKFLLLRKKFDESEDRNSANVTNPH